VRGVGKISGGMALVVLTRITGKDDRTLVMSRTIAAGHLHCPASCLRDDSIIRPCFDRTPINFEVWPVDLSVVSFPLEYGGWIRLARLKSYYRYSFFLGTASLYSGHSGP
jgi:hypothetical protein